MSIKTLRFKYVLLYLFITVYIYYSVNGSYIELKKTFIMNEFYTSTQNKNIEITHFSSEVARSGTYILGIRYYVPNSTMTQDDYSKILNNNGWKYQKQAAAYNENIPIVGKAFTKDRVRLDIYLLGKFADRELVSVIYFYEKN